MRPLFFILLFSISLSNIAQNQGSELYLLGKFNPGDHPDFTIIGDSYCNRPGMYLHKDAYNAFKSMFYAAKKCGVNIRIISATRSFAYQRGIWERKWRSDRFADKEELEKARKIMLYSAMPGASRHHWGTDIDLNELNNEYFESGEGKEVYEWLITHASEYGFHQPYTPKNNGRTGYEEEKWHWTYLPLSSDLLEHYNEKINYQELRGFTGAEYAKDLKVIEDYVNGVELK